MVLDLTELSTQQTKDYNSIYREMGDEYTSFVETLNRRFGTDKYWWCTSISSRNASLSGLREKIAILLLTIREIDSLKQGNLTVRVPDATISKCLKKYYSRRDINLKIECLRNKRKLSQRLVLSFSSLFGVIRQICDIRRRFKTCDRRIKENDLIVLESYAYPNSFSKGEYSDRHLGTAGLPEEAVTYMPFFIPSKKGDNDVFEKSIKENRNQNFIIKEAFLHPCDFFRIFEFAISLLHFRRHSKIYNNIDVSSIFNSEIIKELFNSNSIYAVMNFWEIKRIVEAGIRMRLVICWYEGQESSNSLAYAIHKFAPTVTVVGCEGFPLDDTQIELAPSEQQIQEGAAPSIIGVIGPVFGLMPRRFSTFVKTLVLPPPRKLNMDRISADNPKSDRDEKTKEIFVSMSYYHDYNCRIVELLNSIALKLNENDCMIHIKNHPDYMNYVMENYSSEPINFRYDFVSGNFTECVGKSRLVISAEGSMPFEAVLLGYPVILVFRQGYINRTRMPKEWEGKRYGVAYNSDDLLENILFFMSQKSLYLDESIIEKYYSNKPDEKVKDLLDGKIEEI